MKKKIEEADWKWYGSAGHFCLSSMCRFHLTTEVGKYLVSTVGEFVPGDNVREILAQSRGIVLEGRGDEREADWMKKVGFEDIGLGRKYETMVFKAGVPCKNKLCGECGMPSIDGSELDMDGYNTAKDAMKGHYWMCRKFSAK